VTIMRKIEFWKVIAPSLTIFAILIFLSGCSMETQSDQSEKSVMRFVHTHDPSKYVFLNPPIISPDGKKIVYVADPEGFYNLYIRKLDQEVGVTTVVKKLPYGGVSPFFSPDSKELCFFMDGKLKKLNIESEQVSDICDVTSWRGGTWGDDGTIIFASDEQGLLQISASSVGGTPKTLISPTSEQSRSYYRHPEMLPGSKAVLYTAWEGSSSDETNIAVYSLETGKSETLINGQNPRYSPTGHILFGRLHSCFAVPFDAKQLKITGQEVLVQNDVNINRFRFSKNGTLIYVPYKPVELSLHLVDRFGRETLFTNLKGLYHQCRISPDGTRVAFGSGGPVWIHDVTQDAPHLFTSEGTNTTPEWTPDGKNITFSSNRSGVYNIYLKRTDGTGNAEPLFTSEKDQWGGSWSGDGTLFTFMQDDPTTNVDIWVYNTRNSAVSQFLSTPNQEYLPVFSPDGKCIAYTSDKTGQGEIYITTYPGPGPQLQVSTEGGEGAFWAPDGKELFYRNGDKMMVVPVSTGPLLKPGHPELMFEKHYVYDTDVRHYDILPNGKQFLMAKDDPLLNNQIIIILNWFEVLKEKMASAN
jgi:Tol biopolymer transport system component